MEELYFTFGNIPYAIGEGLSQLEHGLQCAELAQQAGHKREFVLACLLHDIGHLIGARDGLEAMGSLGALNHEQVGADWLLERGFSEYTATLVRHHTTAKRYLAATRPEYMQQLSEASKKTLALQGGPMTEQEQVDFENQVHYLDFIAIRQFDDAAKVPVVEDVQLQRERWKKVFM